MLVIVLSVLCVFLFIFSVILWISKIIYKHKYLELERVRNYTVTLDRAKMSMVEYVYRSYKEGENPFTVLRKLSNIISSTTIEEVSDYES